MINKTLKYLSIITLLYSTSCTNAPRYNKSDFSRQTKGNKISNKTEFIIGLNQEGCRPLNENTNKCHYKNALKFIEKYNQNIKYIFFPF